jgi:CRP-like cAMP-binding protein
MSQFTSLPSSAQGLRQIHLLAGLPEAVLQEMASHCHFRRYAPQAEVLSRHDEDRALHLLISGRLRVVALSPSGREVSFRDLAAGDHVGEIAAIDGGPRTATVIALEECLLARLPAADLQALMQRHWPICERVLHGLTRSVRHLTDRVYEISTLSVQQRLAAELVRMALAESGGGANRVRLTGLPPQRELGARIGSYREQVAREMAQLQRLGLVSKDGDGLMVEDIGRLSELVNSTK